MFAVMSLFFLGLMIFNYGQELPFGCGCFGFNGAELVGIRHVARELLIFVIASLVFALTMRKGQAKKEEKIIQ